MMDSVWALWEKQLNWKIELSIMEEMWEVKKQVEKRKKTKEVWFILFNLRTTTEGPNLRV